VPRVGRSVRDGDTITILVSKAPRKQWWRN
jgi:hypothetical protein